mgnify:FL=1
MKERPILFSSPMVRAILEGRKTQTRRVIKPQPKLFADPNSEYFGQPWMPIGGLIQSAWRFPYGQPGDRLWVRATWAMNQPPSGAIYRSDGECDGGPWKPSIHMPRWASRITLEVTGVRVVRLKGITESEAEAEGMSFTDYGRQCFHQGMDGDIGKCPSPDQTHPQRPGWFWEKTTSSGECLPTARLAFANLWNSINGPGSRDLNPWVWAITFKRI